MVCLWLSLSNEWFLQLFYPSEKANTNFSPKTTTQTFLEFGQWLWLSWQSGRFRYQRSAVRIQTSANFYRTLIYCQLYCIEKTKIKEKEAGNCPSFFKRNSRILPFSRWGILRPCFSWTCSWDSNRYFKVQR